MNMDDTASDLVDELIDAFENGPPPIDCWCGKRIEAEEFFTKHGLECPAAQEVLAIDG